VREAGGVGLAQQGGDAPDTRQLVAAGGAGPLSVGAVRRRLALAVPLILLLLALVVALAGARPLGPGRRRRCCWRSERQSWRLRC
jgi:hypothetical protein